jgi:two-component system response regulator YesN
MIKVLIVDDDKLVRKGLISAMPWQDFDMEVVGEANNGKKALEILEQQSVDLLITDLAMPVMSGIELIRIAHKRFPQLHIVVLTLHQDFEYIQEALRIGAIDYIAKIQLEKERFEEVLERIANRIKEQHQNTTHVLHGDEGDPVSSDIRSDDLFYDYHPDHTIVSVSILDKATNQLQGRDEEAIDKLKDQWLSLGWLRNDSQLTSFIHDLKSLRLPKVKLIGLLYILVNEWNRLFAQTLLGKIQVKDTYDYWYQVESWLRDIVDTTRSMVDKSPYSQEIMDCIMRAVHIMQAEMGAQLTLNDIAKRLNISRSYFSQCFKDIVGRTFNEHTRYIRIEKAKEHLISSNKTIIWIAENIGYLDEKYFSRTFREETGLLPSEYRKTHRKGRIMTDR